MQMNSRAVAVSTGAVALLVASSLTPANAGLTAPAGSTKAAQTCANTATSKVRVVNLRTYNGFDCTKARRNAGPINVGEMVFHPNATVLCQGERSGKTSSGQTWVKAECRAYGESPFPELKLFYRYKTIERGTRRCPQNSSWIGNVRIIPKSAKVSCDTAFKWADDSIDGVTSWPGGWVKTPRNKIVQPRHHWQIRFAQGSGD